MFMIRYSGSAVSTERNTLGARCPRFDTHDSISMQRYLRSDIRVVTCSLPSRCVNLQPRCPPIMEIMRLIASISDDTPAGITPAGIVMASTAMTVIATAVFAWVVIVYAADVQAGIAFASADIDCSECMDYSSCIDYLVFADYLLRGDYSLNSHCFVRGDFGVNASLGVSTDLGVSAGFGACAGYPVCADFPLPDVFGMRACLPLRRGCLDRPAPVNARTITR